jgi:hypothetical protein
MLQPAMRPSIGTTSIVLVTLLTGCSGPSAPVELASAPVAPESTAPAQVEPEPELQLLPRPEPVRLRWTFRDGDRYRWTYESGMDIEGPRGDETVKATVKVRMTFDVDVAAEETDRVRLHYDLVRLELASNAPELPIDYDSDKAYPEVPDLTESAELSDEELLSRMVAEKLSDLKQLEIETAVDASGEIHELEVVGALEKLAELQGLETLLFLIEQDGLNSLHAGGFVRLPDDEFVPGSTWEQTTSVPVKLGTISFAHTATYAGPEVVDGSELLRFDTTITTSSIPTAAAAEFVQFEDVGGSGVLYFNHHDGQLDSYRYRSDITMTMSIPSEDEKLSGHISYFSNTFLQRIEADSSPAGSPAESDLQ